MRFFQIECKAIDQAKPIHAFASKEFEDVYSLCDTGLFIHFSVCPIHTVLQKKPKIHTAATLAVISAQGAVFFQILHNSDLQKFIFEYSTCSILYSKV